MTLLVHHLRCVPRPVLRAHPVALIPSPLATVDSSTLEGGLFVVAALFAIEQRSRYGIYRDWYSSRRMPWKQPQQQSPPPPQQAQPSASQQQQRRQQQQQQSRRSRSRMPRMMVAPTPRPLPASALLQYERQGYLADRRLLDAAAVRSLARTLDEVYTQQRLAALRQKVRVLLGEEALAEAEAKAGVGRGGGGGNGGSGASSSSVERLSRRLERMLEGLPDGAVPFLQLFNTWRHAPAVLELLRSPAVAGTAAQLLGVDASSSSAQRQPRVRLYQDSLFVKRAGDGETHWHADLAMAPLDTNDLVTCWLPLQVPTRRPPLMPPRHAAASAPEDGTSTTLAPHVHRASTRLHTPPRLLTRRRPCRARALTPRSAAHVRRSPFPPRRTADRGSSSPAARTATWRCLSGTATRARCPTWAAAATRRARRARSRWATRRGTTAGRCTARRPTRSRRRAARSPRPSSSTARLASRPAAAPPAAAAATATARGCPTTRTSRAMRSGWAPCGRARQRGTRCSRWSGHHSSRSSRGGRRGEGAAKAARAPRRGGAGGGARGVAAAVAAPADRLL